MKKIFSLSIGLLFIVVGNAQTKTTTTKPGPKPVAKTATPVVLKDLKDSASYAMGLFVINVFSQQGINDINGAIVSKAINDIQSKKSSYK